MSTKKCATSPLRASHCRMVRDKKETREIENRINEGLKKGKIFKIR